MTNKLTNILFVLKYLHSLIDYLTFLVCQHTKLFINQIHVNLVSMLNKVLV